MTTVTTKPTRPEEESHSAWGALSSEPDELTLPGWLNAAKGTSSYKRVVHILELMRNTEQSAQDVVSRGAHVHVGPQGSKWPSEKIRLMRAASKVHEELERTLRRYRFNIRFTHSLMGHWMFNMYCPRQRNDFGLETRCAYRASPGTTIVTVPTYVVFEGDAVLAAGRLAERGILSRVRLCATCSDKWLFAKHRNYRFCSPECRERYYTETDEYRQKKARQMRECRDRQRKREESERSLAAFKNLDGN
jgi:hypothetical protein